jgi:predicted nucleic acid-binding protein
MPALFVVDNSIVMTWCFDDDDGGDYADAVLESLQGNEALVPAVWPLEVGNALLAAERRQRLNQAESIRFLELLGALPIRVEQETPERMLKEVVALAREQKLSTYDASYLDLAMRRDLSLATRDIALAEAARRCGISLFEPKQKLAQ